MKVCNGKCGWWASCPSKRAEVGDLKKRSGGDDGEERAEKPRERKEWEWACAASGTTTCGVFGGNKQGWECVDTKTDLESCASRLFLLIFVPVQN